MRLATRFPSRSWKVCPVGVCLGAACLLALALVRCGEDPPPEDEVQTSCEGVAPDDGHRGAPDATSANIELATAIAHRYIDEHPIADAELRWDWTEAVLMFGMVELHRLTGDSALLDYYRQRMDAHLMRGWKVTWSDHCPMALTALDLYQRTPDAAERAAYREVVDAVLEYLFTTAPRNDHGAIAHLGAEVAAIDSIWVDSLFMFGAPLSRWGACDGPGDGRALDLLAEQLGVFAELLEDEPGLFTHAYGWPLEQTPGVFWARGNSWVTASLAEYARARSLRGESDPAVRQLLERHVEAVSALQDTQTGLWWTVLDRPGQTYLETSASALFAYGMARAWRYGWLDDAVLPVVFRAVEGVRSRIDRDPEGRPVVTGISGPTGVGTLESYATVDLVDDETYGVGAVLLLLTETSGIAPPCQPCIEPSSHPRLLATPDMQDELRQRAGVEPYASILEVIRARAAEEIEHQDGGTAWDPEVWSRNGNRAVANAFLAWVFDDDVAAERARELLLALEARFPETTQWDANIRMAGVSISYTDAWDLTMATGAWSLEEGAAVAETLTTLNQQLYERFVIDPLGRNTTCYIAQNNHCLRTAASIGYVALAFPEHPRAKEWLDFATSEMDYLYGPDGHYLQAGGGSSEGPFYFQFGLAPSLAFLIRFQQLFPEGRLQERSCLMRIDIDPWTDHQCVAGGAFRFQSPLDEPLFLDAVDWAVGLRLPNGMMPPLEDAGIRALNGPALLTAVGGGPHLLWAWRETLPDPMNMTRGAELPAYYYTMLDAAVAPAEPPWRNRFLPAVGHAVLRSDHGPDARWLLLVAEEGDARKTLHDHVDSLSFSMAAYGDYLLIDSGYYAPSDLLNAATVAAASHNLILVDGAALEKGEFHDWQEADAYLRHTLDGEVVAWAEAHQSYLETNFERGVALVRGRYYVIADHLETAVTEAREFRWRAHAGADYDPAVYDDLGGTWALDGDALRVEGETGGVVVRIGSTEGPVAFEEPAHVALQPPHVHEFVAGRGVGEHGVADGVVTGLAPDFLAVLAPYALAAAPGTADAEPVVTALEAGPGAVAWLVETAAGADVAWLRGPDAADTLALGDGTELMTDGRVAIVALDGSFALITRGSTVALNGLPLIDGEQRDVVSTESP